MPSRKVKDKYPNIDYNKHRRDNYKQTEIPLTRQERVKRIVTNEELILIEKHEITDRELSKIIKRSVAAIQMIRTKLKYGKYKIEKL